MARTWLEFSLLQGYERAGDGDARCEADKGALRLEFDCCLLLQFRGSAITSDAGLLPIADWMRRWARLIRVVKCLPMCGPARRVAIAGSLVPSWERIDPWGDQLDELLL